VCRNLIPLNTKKRHLFPANIAPGTPYSSRLGFSPHPRRIGQSAVKFQFRDVILGVRSKYEQKVTMYRDRAANITRSRRRRRRPKGGCLGANAWARYRRRGKCPRRGCPERGEFPGGADIPVANVQGTHFEGPGGKNVRTRNCRWRAAGGSEALRHRGQHPTTTWLRHAPACGVLMPLI